jgi:hypothetical protein
MKNAWKGLAAAGLQNLGAVGQLVFKQRHLATTLRLIRLYLQLFKSLWRESLWNLHFSMKKGVIKYIELNWKNSAPRKSGGCCRYLEKTQEYWGIGRRCPPKHDAADLPGDAPDQGREWGKKLDKPLIRFPARS